MNRMPWKTFYVFVAGQTNNTHNKIVKMLTNSGHSESVSPEDCDYCVVFCPVVSRLESDVSSALNNSPAGKPIILVVMHYHHDPQQTVIQSNRSVENPNVHLTVDCLFYKDQLLKCNTNDEAASEILKFLGLEQGSSYKNVINCLKRHRLKVSLLAGLVVAVVVLTVIFTGKPIILVVMHYTFNPEYIFIQSRRSVENPTVHLTVDSLFYKDQLLKCNTNDEASSKILRFLGLEDSSKKFFNFRF